MTKYVALSGLTLIGLSSLLLAQENSDELPPLTVLAKKFSASADDTVSTVGVISADELERIQQSRLLNAVNSIPGVLGLSTGGLTGNTGTVLSRGLGTNYSQAVFDGVKVADSTNGLGNYLANGTVGSISSIEILRGPQSVLYGTGAAAGVIGYESQVGDGEPTFRFFGETGSFDTNRSAFSSRGKLGDLQYGFEIGTSRTESDTFSTLPRHYYHQDQASVALQYEVNSDLTLKLSYRGNENELETLSLSSFGSSESLINTDTHLVAFNALMKMSEIWNSRLTLGYYQESYDGDFDGAFGASIFDSNYERLTANWNHRFNPIDELEILAGLEFAHSDYLNSSGRSVNYQTYGAYVNTTWRPVESLLLEAGGRYDESRTLDGDFAWNAGVAWQPSGNDGRLRLRISESYRTPTILDSEGFMGGFINQLPNNDLASEEIRAFEFGYDHDFGDHSLEATLFHQELKNAIITRSGATFNDPSQRVNSAGTSRVSGLELALQGELITDVLRYRLAWTEQDREEVIDVPDRILNLDLNYDGGNWLAGAGASHVSGASYGPSGNASFVATDDRTLVRLYGEYEITENVKIHARVENLFDDNYLLSNAFGSRLEGQGREYHIGATFNW